MAPARTAPAARTEPLARASAGPAALPEEGIAAGGTGGNGLPTTNGVAVLLMVVSMALFAADDALLKLASALPRGTSPGEVIAFHGGFGAIVFAAMMRLHGDRLTRHLLAERAVQWRTGGDVVAASAFVTALTLMELGPASAILQVQPLVVTLGAALLLGERVGPRRRVAVVVGLIGVIVIIRPGLSGFTPVSILVLVGVMGLAARDLSTRVVPARHSTAAISLLVCLAMMPSGVLLHLALDGDVPFVGVSGGAFARIAAAATVGTLGYWCITQAGRVGEVSAIAPFRYSRLVFALVLGWLVFGERPDAAMIAGSLLVVGAGAYALRREAKLAA